MSQIGADTAQMRATIAALRQGRENVQDAVQRAAQAMQALQGSRWSGQHRVQIEERWEQIQTQFTPTLEVLDRLATRTERLADAFEDAARVFGGAAGEHGGGINNPAYRNLLGNLLGGAMPGLLALLSMQDYRSIFNISKQSGNVLDAMTELLKQRKYTQELFKDIGRSLNDITDSRGYVGLSDDAYKVIFGTRTDQAKLLKILDSKAVTGALTVADIAAGVTEDWYNKTYTVNGTENIDWAKLIGVNAIDGGLELAISSTGVGAAILLVNSGIQLGGTVGLGLQQSYDTAIASESNRDALSKGVENASQSLERADLGNVIKSTSELIYTTQFEGIGDGINMVSKVAQDPSLETFNQALEEYQKKRVESVSSAFGNTLRSVGNFADGLVDLEITAPAAIANTGIATISNIAQRLPIEQSTKDTIDKTLTHIIETNQRVSELQMNMFDFGKDNQGSWFNLPSKEDLAWFRR